MRTWFAALAGTMLALPAALLAYSTPPPAKSAPPVIPYLCGDGHVANVIYESGSDFGHAKARVSYEGRMLELRAAPTLYGVRYRGEEGGTALAWTLRGEQAWLTEAPDEESYVREEREIARCARLRGALPYAAAPGHGGHGDDH